MEQANDHKPQLFEEPNQCPQCRSHNVSIGYPDIVCRSCGWREPLYDFPISHDLHRALMIKHGHADPGPDYPTPPPEPDEEPQPEPEWTRRQWDYVEQLRWEIRYLDKKLTEATEAMKKVKPPRPEPDTKPTPVYKGF